MPEGQRIMNETDCKACHGTDVKVNGPSYVDIAEKYAAKDRDYLIGKVIKGGSGVWGETAMSAHPQLSIDEVGLMIDYIFSLKKNKSTIQEMLPLRGTLEFNQHRESDLNGIYILTASYLDQGHPSLAGSYLSAQQQVIFRVQKDDTDAGNETE